MTETVKNKKKPKSLSAKLKDMKKERDGWHKRWRSIWDDNRKLYSELRELKSLLPVKYYKIEFKMKANTGGIYTYTENHESYTAEGAIQKLKENKTYPDTFELIDIKLMA